MNKKALTLTVVANMTSNYSEGLGNVASVQIDYLDDKSVAWMDENYDATPQTIMLESIRDDIFCQTN